VPDIPGTGVSTLRKGTPVIKFIRMAAAVAVLCLTGGPASARDANIEWNLLNQEVSDLYHAGKYDRAITVAKKALEVAEKNVGPVHPDVAASLNNLALLYYTQGRYAQAEPLYKRALAMYEKALGPDHPDVAASLNNTAMFYSTQGR
jgi:tetratricopeptide (TPR) repeat protein